MTNHTPKPFNSGIHGARGLFCLCVVFYHIWNSGLPRWPVPMIVEQAMESLRYGVELFFAISGFVIFATLKPVLNGNKSPLEFIANRATRIFPVLWVTIIIFIPLGIIDGEQSVTAHLQPIWLFNLKLIGNLLALGPIWPVPVFYGVTWTIGYEFIFYCLCFAYLCGHYYLNRNLIWPVLLIASVLVLYHPRGLFFASGILVAAQVLNTPLIRKLAAWPVFWLVAFLFSWQTMAAPVSPFFAPMLDWSIYSEWPTAGLAFISLTLGIAGIVNGSGLFCRLLTTNPMLWLGSISYSLYLWHPIVLGATKFAMNRLGWNTMAGDGAQFLLLLLALPSSLIVSQLSYAILERKLTNWLRRHVQPAAAKTISVI